MFWVSQYVLFLLECFTILLLLIIGPAIFFAKKKQTSVDLNNIQIMDISKQYTNIKNKMIKATLSTQQLKTWEKEHKKRKKDKSEPKDKPIVYIITFKGSVDAHEVESLRHEISAILSVATPKDEVVIKLESPGGVVNGYGLAASQLSRLQQKSLNVTIVIDKVAASGGYMMACTANKIIAAPFAIIGSIGVVAQIPNVHRLLKKHDVDVELHTAGQYKRTLTLIGKNTEEGRKKFQEELEETHTLFKSFVLEHRPNIDIEKVATGEHWYGRQALTLSLIDEIGTSDDYLLAKVDDYKLLHVSYNIKKKLTERLSIGLFSCLDRITKEISYKGNKPMQ